MFVKQYVMPDPVYGTPVFPLGWDEINWLQDLPNNTYFALWANVHSSDKNPIQLPQGHPLYVITFHQEHFNSEWLLEQVKNIDAPVIVLCDGSIYNLPLPPNVHFYTYFSWHHHIDQIIKWFPKKQKRNIKYKVSNVCNRITQSKLIVFTALMEYLDRDDLLVKLSNWLEPVNVHYWNKTNNQSLDYLTDVFKTKYLGKTIEIDNFDNARDNFQSINSNPWQPLYTESALHFVSESYHYSLMHNEYGEIILPGPSFSEKLYKCLIAGTPFVPVAQFESYKHLSDLGLKFDYGNIDLSWDNDPGNLTRLASIVDMIKTLKDYSIADIVDMTRESTDHNTDHIWSGAFRNQCQLHNQSVAEEIINKFK